MKECKQCSKQFEPKSFRGTEQNYCSKECRTKAGNERYKLKLMTNGSNTISTESSEQSLRAGSSERIGTKQFISNDNYRGENNGSSQISATNFSELVRFMEQTYGARTDANKYQLKYEIALKEIETLKQEILELKLELDEEPEPKKGIIGMLDEIPEWITPAIGKLLQSDKVQKFVINAIPEPEQ